MADTSSFDVALVTRIAEAGSLSAAARQLHLSPTSVSTRLADVERRLGAALFRRSTRSLALTQEGERYLAVARPVLDLLGAAEDAVRGVADPATMTGSIRLSAPVDLGRQIVATMVDNFMAAHPRIHVSLLLTDEVTDLRTQNVDLAIRYGDMPSTNSTVVTTLADNRRLICGAPAYLDRRGRPTSPEDLKAHNCLCLQTASSHIRRWPVGKSWVDVEGDRSTNDGGLLRIWAVAGHGLILKSWWDVRTELAGGLLEEVLIGSPVVTHSLRLARPAWREVPLRVSLLVDHLKHAMTNFDVAGKLQDGSRG